MLKEITKYNVGIFSIFKANFGSFYPAGGFIIKGYSTSSRLDGNRSGNASLPIDKSQDLYLINIQF